MICVRLNKPNYLDPISNWTFTRRSTSGLNWGNFCHIFIAHPFKASLTLITLTLRFFIKWKFYLLDDFFAAQNRNHVLQKKKGQQKAKTIDSQQSLNPNIDLNASSRWCRYEPNAFVTNRRIVLFFLHSSFILLSSVSILQQTIECGNILFSMWRLRIFRPVTKNSSIKSSFDHRHET